MKCLKSISVCLGVVLFVMGVSAQGANTPVDKGSWMLSTNGGFATYGGDLYEKDGSRYSRIDAHLSLNRFIVPGFYFGGEVGLTHINQIGSSTYWTFGPGLGYVFGSENIRPNIKGQTLAHVGITALLEMNHYSPDYHEHGRIFSLDGGMFFMISRSAGLNLAARYDLESLESVNGNAVSITVGFVVFLWERFD